MASESTSTPNLPEERPLASKSVENGHKTKIPDVSKAFSVLGLHTGIKRGQIKDSLTTPISQKTEFRETRLDNLPTVLDGLSTLCLSNSAIEVFTDNGKRPQLRLLLGKESGNLEMVRSQLQSGISVDFNGSVVAQVGEDYSIVVPRLKSLLQDNRGDTLRFVDSDGQSLVLRFSKSTLTGVMLASSNCKAISESPDDQ